MEISRDKAILMNQEKLWLEFSTLSPQAQTLVLDFIRFVKTCSNQLVSPRSSLESSDVSIAEDALEDWCTQVREEHPFMHMNKADILAQLKQTRSAVYDELYGERHAR